MWSIPKVILHLICVLVHILSVMSECKEPEPIEDVEINETDNGVTLLTMNNWNVNLSLRVIEYHNTREGYFDRFFQLQRVNYSTAELRLLHPVDLDMDHGIDKTFYMKGMVLVVYITCFDMLTLKDTIYFRLVFVTSVDEFKPSYQSLEVYKVREDTRPGTNIAQIRSEIVDGDHDSITDKYYFSTSAYLPNSSTDGRPFFKVNQEGDVISLPFPDFEEGNKSYHINFTAENQWKEFVQGIINIDIVNVNDNSPKFIYMGCTYDCIRAHYKVMVTPDFTGKLNSSLYQPIVAIDDDGDSIVYSFVGGSPKCYSEYLQIDNQSGILSVVKPLDIKNIGVFVIVVQARSVSTLPATTGVMSEVIYSHVFLKIYGRESILYKVKRLLASSHSERNLPWSFCMLGSILMIMLVLQVWCEFESWF